MNIRDFVKMLHHNGLEPIVEYSGPWVQQVSVCDRRVMFERQKTDGPLWPSRWTATDHESGASTVVAPVAPNGWVVRLWWWWVAQKSR